MTGLSGKSYDIVIVGGGAIGCTTAYFLCDEGLKVALVDRRKVGREASWASAGIVCPSSSPKGDAWFLRATTLSKRLYDELNPRLFEETGRRVDYGGEGRVIIALDDSEADQAKAHLAARVKQGVRGELLTGEEAREKEPALPGAVLT